MSRVNIRHTSNAQMSFWDGSLCVYLNLLKQCFPILSKVRRSVFVPPEISRAKCGCFSYFLCCLSSLRCLFSERSPKRNSRLCVNGNSISSNVSKVLKNNSRASAELTTTGISAIVCGLFLAGTANTHLAIQKASALSTTLRALARTRFLRVRSDTGLGGLGFTVLGGSLTRLLVRCFAFQNFRTGNGNNFLGQCCEFFKLARFAGLGWFHEGRIYAQGGGRKLRPARGPMLFFHHLNHRSDWRRISQCCIGGNAEKAIQGYRQLRKDVHAFAALQKPIYVF